MLLEQQEAERISENMLVSDSFWHSCDREDQESLHVFAVYLQFAM